MVHNVKFGMDCVWMVIFIHYLPGLGHNWYSILDVLLFQIVLQQTIQKIDGIIGIVNCLFIQFSMATAIICQDEWITTSLSNI